MPHHGLGSQKPVQLLRWPRGWPQTPVRTIPHLVGRGEATVEIENDRFGHWHLDVFWRSEATEFS